MAKKPVTAIELPPKMVELFDGDWRYRGAKGGRGSGKTRGFAKMAAVRGYQFGRCGIQGQILCGREMLNSIDESSLTEIKMAIREHDWLDEYYDIGERYIKSKDGNIEFAFVGLKKNLSSIRSKARLLLAWIEEAEDVSDAAWRVLIPTVREANSEIWLSWNPELENSPTDERFVKNPSANMKIVEMNYRDNPWFPQVLEQERLDDRQLRPDTYDHVWEGDYLEIVKGAYYAEEMRAAKEEGRICRVPWEPELPVMTAWDLGMDDDMAIWFFQVVGREVRLIDYYENSGKGMAHYTKLLQGKPYTYDYTILPHDAKVRELGTGKSRAEVIAQLGFKDQVVLAPLPVDDGIQATRALLSQCWFDQDKCLKGIASLKGYRREFHDKNQVFHNKPLHNWCSHGADAFRYLATGRRIARGWGSGPLKRNLKTVA